MEPYSNLTGVRVWLSGAIPSEASESQAASMRQFIEGFSARVFQSGGNIIHGSHPTVTPLLLTQAQEHVKAGGRRDCLTLAVSRYCSKDTASVTIQNWREHCLVYETPEVGGASARDDSLRVLRQWMASRCDAFVAIGGMWWKNIVGRAGVPLEASLAIEHGIPCFLLGGLGGAATNYVNTHPEVLRSLKNGFDLDKNRAVATQENVEQLIETIIKQLSLLPLIRGRVSEGVSFRILALDGGGIRGAFTASVLATLEESIGVPIASQFDLIAGTSTGGILAIALGMGLQPADMLRFYRERGPTVFPIVRFHKRLRSSLLHAIRPKYSQTVLRRELERAYFPDNQPKVLGDSICRLVIPAYDAVSGVCHVFRTPHHSLLRADASTNAAEVAMATAAAPTYFSSAVVRNMVSQASFFDGGVWAVCPAMAAVVEAVCYLNVPLDRIDVLSVGTTDEPFTVKSMAEAGWVRWGKTLIDLLLNAQLDASVRHAQLLVGEPRFLRVNVTTTPGMYALDGAKEIEDLIALGNRRASQPDILNQVKSRFLNGIEAMDWREDAKHSYDV
jgi:uncharacterized protein